SCPECESELEVSQIHPVHLNVISEDMDDDEDEEDDEEGEPGENGDLPKDEEEDDEEDDEEKFYLQEPGHLLFYLATSKLLRSGTHACSVCRCLVGCGAAGSVRRSPGASSTRS